MQRLLLLLALIGLMPACAAGYTYRGSVPYQPGLRDVPPDFYGGDPAMAPWFTYPYWPAHGP